MPSSRSTRATSCKTSSGCKGIPHQSALNTVRAHSRRLYAKLEVHTRDELQDLIGL